MYGDGPGVGPGDPTELGKGAMIGAGLLMFLLEGRLSWTTGASFQPPMSLRFGGGGKGASLVPPLNCPLSGGGSGALVTCGVDP